MRQIMIVEQKFLPIPLEIRIVFDAGPITIMPKNDKEQIVSGRYMVLDGMPKIFISWLKKYDAVWVNKPGTSMQEQEFVVAHIKEDLMGCGHAT